MEICFNHLPLINIDGGITPRVINGLSTPESTRLTNRFCLFIESPFHPNNAGQAVTAHTWLIGSASSSYINEGRRFPEFLKQLLELIVTHFSHTPNRTGSENSDAQL